MSSIYQINKGIGKPVEFKGLYGQYIAYLAGGLVLLLIGFAVLYVSGVPIVLVLPLILTLGAGLYFAVTSLSRRFGVHGLGKYMAKRALPEYLKFKSRRVFTTLRSSGSLRASSASGKAGR